MSRRNKLEKFSELTQFRHVLEYSEEGFTTGLLYDGTEDIHLKGKWRPVFFNNDNPIVVELACGRGEYSCALAEMYPNRNFIGVDVKGARIWKGAKHAQDNLNNVGFLRIRIEHIEYFFDKAEVNEIWITFPDPFLKGKKANRRLTSPEFLARFQKILEPKGIIHLKTDDDQLYEFTLQTIADFPTAQLINSNDDIYKGANVSEELSIKTYYEDKHLSNGKRIKYIQFSLS